MYIVKSFSMGDHTWFWHNKVGYLLTKGEPVRELPTHLTPSYVLGFIKKVRIEKW